MVGFPFCVKIIRGLAKSFGELCRMIRAKRSFPREPFLQFGFRFACFSFVAKQTKKMLSIIQDVRMPFPKNRHSERKRPAQELFGLIQITSGPPAISQIIQRMGQALVQGVGPESFEDFDYMTVKIL